MKKRIFFWGLIVAVALAAYGGRLAWRAHQNLVTLEVRNMDVREVISKIEWQTWERIIVHKDVKGKITLKVEDAQLGDVLNIIGEQADARWSALFPLFTAGDKLVAFKKIVRGDLQVEGSSWTNWQNRGSSGFGRGGFGGFGDMMRAQAKLVNLDVANRDFAFATLALARYPQAQVIGENGTDGTLNIHLKQVPFDDVVAAIAKQVHRKWDDLYTLQPSGFRGRGGPEFGGGDGPPRDGGRDRGDRRRSDGTNRVDDPLFAEQLAEQRRAQMDAQRQRAQEAQLATMTAEEQKQAEDRRKEFEQMRNMSPEERQQRFQQMASSPEFQQRMQQRSFNRVMNTTPEQRVDRAQRRLEMQKRREQNTR